MGAPDSVSKRLSLLSEDIDPKPSVGRQNEDELYLNDSHGRRTLYLIQM